MEIRRPALSFVGVASLLLLGASGTTLVASRGQPMDMIPGWPDGVHRLINDLVRTEGWNPWFTECPNDVNYFGLDVRGAKDINRLIKKLAAVEADHVELHLLPEPGAPHANGVGSVFVLGNQLTMDDWFNGLREVEPGVRQFGVHRYRVPPKAQSPTLVLYVGHKAVDLSKLEVPPIVEVTTGTAKAYRDRHAEVFRMIDQFIEKHRLRQRESGRRKPR